MKIFCSVILILLIFSGCGAIGTSDGLEKQNFIIAAQSYLKLKYNEKIEIKDDAVKFDGKGLHYFQVYAHPVGLEEYTFRVLMEGNYLSDNYPETKWGIQGRKELLPIFKQFLSDNASLKDIDVYSDTNDVKHEVNVPEYSILKNDFIRNQYTKGLIRQNFYIEMKVQDYDKYKELKKVLDLILFFRSQGISFDLLDVSYPKWKIRIYDQEVISKIKNFEDLKKNQYMYNYDGIK